MFVEEKPVGFVTSLSPSARQALSEYQALSAFVRAKNAGLNYQTPEEDDNDNDE
jgi:hypothetical protein